MQEAYVNICDIPTHVMTWGKWIEESMDDVKEIVVCITGNPGLSGFYTKFLSTVHSNLDPNIPVWIIGICHIAAPGTQNFNEGSSQMTIKYELIFFNICIYIGHAGHDDPPKTSIRKVPPLTGNERCFSLDGQVKHKIEFIEKYIPRNVKVHLIGHSIGAWIILQLLKQPQIKERVQKCYMLFPTIERMIETWNGWLFTRICVPLMPVIKILLLLLNKLPVSLRTFLIYIYFWLFSIPTYFIGTTLKYLRLPVIERVVFMAKEEMSVVKDLDVHLVKDNINLLRFYYGGEDGWVPVKYYNEIKMKIPDLDAVLDNRKILHAFVLRSSGEMGEIVANWIKEFSISVFGI